MPLPRPVRWINRLFTLVSSVLTAAVMLIVLQDVVRRYFFNDPSEWTLDVCSFLLVYIFFLALAPALEWGNHVKVDFLEERMPARWRSRLAVAAYLLVVAFGLVLFWEIYVTTREAFVENYLTSSAMPIRLKYIYVIGPIGTAQFIVTAAAMLAAAVGGLRRQRREAASAGRSG